MGRLQGAQHVFARAGAGIDDTPLTKRFQCIAVITPTLALGIRPERPAAIVPFLPLQPKPAEVFDHSGDELGFAAGRIEIFIAQNECAGFRASAILRDPERARVTQVQVAGR